MNHNAEEIKTSAVVQCLFRLTAALFLIKMGLGRPFWTSLLFILHCPHPVHLHTQAPSFALSHSFSYTHIHTQTRVTCTHCIITQSHTHSQQRQHTVTLMRPSMCIQPHSCTQAHRHTWNTFYHTREASVSLSHTLNNNLSQMQSHICIKLQSVTHALHTQSQPDTQRQSNQSQRPTHAWLVTST